MEMELWGKQEKWVGNQYVFWLSVRASKFLMYPHSLSSTKFLWIRVLRRVGEAHLYLIPERSPSVDPSVLCFVRVKNSMRWRAQALLTPTCGRFRLIPVILDGEHSGVAALRLAIVAKKKKVRAA